MHSYEKIEDIASISWRYVQSDKVEYDTQKYAECN